MMGDLKVMRKGLCDLWTLHIPFGFIHGPESGPLGQTHSLQSAFVRLSYPRS